MQVDTVGILQVSHMDTGGIILHRDARCGSSAHARYRA